MIISYKTRLFLNTDMGVHFSSFHFKNSTESFILVLLKTQATQVSVRNVIPTLTSDERQGLSLNGRCQAIRDTRFILVPAEGRTSSSGVLEALYCSAPGVPVVGLLQARRERKRGLQVPGEVAEDIGGELESKCVISCVAVVALPCLFCPVPCGGGVRLPFIGQGESELHVCRTI
jgi:hypothetical protein